ncbi:MAG: hypothetical protein Q7S89_01435, partial [bacterium]|nr:hypothetical protein [bacterium]
MHDKHERRVRYTAATLLTLGVLAVTLLQFRYHLYGPLNRVLYKTARPAGESVVGATVDTTTDTDGDGLPDQIETQQYGTSAYISDSDSDGASDGDEVKAGTDPNCPQGATCGSSGAATTPISAADVSGAQPKDATAESKSPEDIRAFLQQQGVPAELLAKVDNATLLQLYQETVAEVGAPEVGASGSTAEPTAGESTPSKEHLELIGKLSPQTIRLLLEQVGVSKE